MVSQKVTWHDISTNPPFNPCQPLSTSHTNKLPNHLQLHFLKIVHLHKYGKKILPEKFSSLKITCLKRFPLFLKQILHTHISATLVAQHPTPLRLLFPARVTP